MLTMLKIESITSARITAIKKNRYYLFTSEAHETVRLGFTKKTIDRFLELWEDNKTHKEICKALKVTEIELALIAMDLQYAGRLSDRKNGFWGVENE